MADRKLADSVSLHVLESEGQIMADKISNLGSDSMIKSSSISSMQDAESVLDYSFSDSGSSQGCSPLTCTTVHSHTLQLLSRSPIQKAFEAQSDLESCRRKEYNQNSESQEDQVKNNVEASDVPVVKQIQKDEEPGIKPKASWLDGLLSELSRPNPKPVDSSVSKKYEEEKSDLDFVNPQITANYFVALPPPLPLESRQSTKKNIFFIPADATVEDTPERLKFIKASCQSQNNNETRPWRGSQRFRGVPLWERRSLSSEPTSVTVVNP